MSDSIDPDVEYFRRMYRSYDPASIEDDLAFVGEAVDTHLDFEPYGSVGDVNSLLRSAANLAMFAEEYRKRTGSLELPPQ